MWFLLLMFVGIVTAVIQSVMSKQPATAELVSRTILLHQFVVTFGLVGIIGIICNVFFAKQQAAKLGWPGGPFQIKYGFSQLSIGVLGVMAIWFTDHFWVAALVNMYIYGVSGFWTHTLTMIQNKKVDGYSVGSLVMDAGYMTFLTVLSVWARIW